MPRKESLADIVPNRYYDLQATVKYLHHTEKGTTAVIEQDEVQKKIMVPPRTLDLEEGAQYHFPKCFYSRNGWLKVKDVASVEKIQRGRPQENVTMSLEEINERRHQLFNNYVTTTLKVVSIGIPEKKQKNGNQLTLTLVRGFAQNALVDITIWNRQVPKEFLGSLVNFQGFRVKMLTNNTFVLVSTVFSKWSLVNQIVQVQQYHAEKLYPSYSQVYSERTIEQMRQTLKDLTKCFSVVEAKIVDATVFDYEGCKVCHKKMQCTVCSHCGIQTDKATFWVCQLDVEDATDSCTLYVFNTKEQEMLHYAKKGSVVKAKIRSTVRLDSTGENNIESHTLVGIVSIQF